MAILDSCCLLQGPRFRLGLALALLLFPLLTGCAALTNPVAKGIQAANLPANLVGTEKDCEATIPLSLLGQVPPDSYRLAPGDVLGVWIENVLGDRNTPLPLHVGPQVQIREQRKLPAAVGYPVPVEEDGTINLPLVGTVTVTGLTLPEARESLRKIATDKQLLPAGRERVLVTLLQPRQYHVVVMRQESTGFLPGSEGSGKRGSGHVVELAAYENDVLHALAQTGGLPGLDALNEITIYRGFLKGRGDKATLHQRLAGAPLIAPLMAAAGISGQVVHIPLRKRAEEPLLFGPADVILQTGDVVFLEARDRGVFYTGGLLPAGEYPLPRDRDLDVVEAVSLVRGPLVNGAFAVSNLAGNLIAPGIGGPSPRLLTVLRKLPGGGRVPIRVDLHRALCHPDECIRVKPGDMLILQETHTQALARFFSQTLFNFSFTWQPIQSRSATGVIDVSAPERIPARVNITDFTRFATP